MRNPSFQPRRRSLLGLAVLCTAAKAQAAESIPQALARPALGVRHPTQAFLLDVAKAGEQLVAVGERGVVLRSSDLASSWQQSYTPVSVTLTAVRFSDARNGVAVGHGGVVLTTADSGRQWTLRLDGHRAASIVLEAARATGQEETILEAQRLVDEGPDKPLMDALMYSPQSIVVVGAYGIALETHDGGQSWHSWMNRLDNPGGLHYYAIRRSGSTVLIAGEQGMLQLSRDNGRSFQPLETPYSGSFFTAEILGHSDFMVAGLRGNAWRSRDGGVNWAQVSAPSTATITSSTLMPDGLPVLCNQMGMLMALKGNTLAPLKAPPLPGASAVRALDQHSLIALSGRGPIVVDSIAL